MYIVMLGGPGSGKGTASEELSKIYNIEHISTGDMLREEIKNETSLGLQVKELLANGKLVSDDIMIEIIKNKLSSKQYEKGAILDGFPRTKKQAEALDNILKQLGKTLDFAIELDVDDEIIIERIINRELCSNKECGAIYNSKFNPSKVSGICDKCGSNLIKRPDDNRQTVQSRLDVYHKEASDIIEYYKNSKVLFTIKPNQDTKPSEVVNQIVEHIK